MTKNKLTNSSTEFDGSNHTFNEKFFHEIVWKRFIRMPYGHLLDYADKNGNAIYSTAEECEKAMPNPRSWGLPIENGAFFTGLYTYALIEKYNQTKCPKTSDEIKILIRGLLLLQDVGKVEGFIARGVADDGVSHYPMSAECQLLPWVLAIHAYYRTDLCLEKENIRDRLLRALMAVKDIGWRIPCDEDSVFYKESWFDDSAWRSAVMLIYCSRLIYELTGDKKDYELFEELLKNNPKNCEFSRGEIISQGFCHDMLTLLGKGQTWICTYAHLAVRELLVFNEEHREIYIRCLYNNGVTSLKNANNITKYDNKADGFDINWRPLNDLWEDWKNYGYDPDAGTRISGRQFTYWHEKIVPHRHMEHAVLGDSLFSFWVAVTSGDRRIAESALKKLKDNCSRIDWENLHLSYAFVVESTFIFGEYYSKN